MMVDASALCAMLFDEDAARLLAGRLQRSATRLVSPLAVTEATAAVALALGLPAGEAGAEVQRFLDLLGIKTVSLPAQLGPLAASAMERYGATAQRPEGLSPNECLSYAAARYYRLPLLFHGPRFARTDVEAA